MRASNWINLSLLEIIKEYGQINYNTLEKQGRISRVGNLIKFLK